VHSDDLLEQVADYAQDNQRGIVILDAKYKLGVDLKFTSDAKVYIVEAKNVPEREDMM
jgi:hypothetical protein